MGDIMSETNRVAALIELAFMVKSSDPLEGEDVKFLLEKLDFLKDDLESYLRGFQDLIKSGNWDFEDGKSKFKRFSDKHDDSESKKHETVTLNLATEIPAAIELFCSWNPDFKIEGIDGGFPTDESLSEAISVIGDDPALNTICLALCLLFCRLGGRGFRYTK